MAHIAATPFQFANSCPRLYIAMHEDLPKFSSYKFKTFPKLNDTFEGCFPHASAGRMPYKMDPTAWRARHLFQGGAPSIAFDWLRRRSAAFRVLFFAIPAPALPLSQVAKLLDKPDLKIESVHFLGGVGATWHLVSETMLSYTQLNSLCLEDGCAAIFCDRCISRLPLAPPPSRRRPRSAAALRASLQRLRVCLLLLSCSSPSPLTPVPFC